MNTDDLRKHATDIRSGNAMLFHRVADDCEAAADEIDGLRKITSWMPVTADGKCIVPDKNNAMSLMVWAYVEFRHWENKGGPPDYAGIEMGECQFNGVEWEVEFHGGHNLWEYLPVEQCYSTKEACQASRNPDHAD